MEPWLAEHHHTRALQGRFLREGIKENLNRRQAEIDAQGWSDLHSAQPNLDSPVFLAAVLPVVGSDWQVPSESIHQRRFYASHLQLFGDHLRKRKLRLSFSCAADFFHVLAGCVRRYFGFSNLIACPAKSSIPTVSGPAFPAACTSA